MPSLRHMRLYPCAGRCKANKHANNNAWVAWCTSKSNYAIAVYLVYLGSLVRHTIKKLGESNAADICSKSTLLLWRLMLHTSRLQYDYWSPQQAKMELHIYSEILRWWTIFWSWAGSTTVITATQLFTIVHYRYYVLHLNSTECNKQERKWSDNKICLQHVLGRHTHISRTWYQFKQLV